MSGDKRRNAERRLAQAECVTWRTYRGGLRTALGKLNTSIFSPRIFPLLSRLLTALPLPLEKTLSPKSGLKRQPQRHKSFRASCRWMCYISAALLYFIPPCHKQSPHCCILHRIHDICYALLFYAMYLRWWAGQFARRAVSEFVGLPQGCAFLLLLV